MNILTTIFLFGLLIIVVFVIVPVIYRLIKGFNNKSVFSPDDVVPEPRNPESWVAPSVYEAEENSETDVPIEDDEIDVK